MKEETYDKLADLFKAELGKGPFPTEQTHKVARGRGYSQFHAHLTLFLADIAGVASWGRRLQRISHEDRLRFLRIARAGFFEKYLNIVTSRSASLKAAHQTS